MEPVASIDMLTLTRKDRETFTLTSDDAEAENAALGEAIDAVAPHLLKQFDDAETDAQGNLVLEFPKEEWPSLLEILDFLDTGDPRLLNAMGDEVDEAMRAET